MININHVASALRQCATPHKIHELCGPLDPMPVKSLKDMMNTLAAAGLLDIVILKPKGFGPLWRPISPLRYVTTDAGNEWLLAHEKETMRLAEMHADMRRRNSKKVAK